jgi:hypothetical protein
MYCGAYCNSERYKVYKASSPDRAAVSLSTQTGLGFYTLQDRRNVAGRPRFDSVEDSDLEVMFERSKGAICVKPEAARDTPLEWYKAEEASLRMQTEGAMALSAESIDLVVPFQPHQFDGGRLIKPHYDTVSCPTPQRLASGASTTPSRSFFFEQACDNLGGDDDALDLKSCGDGSDSGGECENANNEMYAWPNQNTYANVDYVPTPLAHRQSLSLRPHRRQCDVPPLHPLPGTTGL